MKRLLICTIMRNQCPNPRDPGERLSQWVNQLLELTKLITPEYEVSWSIYENDSTDKTPEALNRLRGEMPKVFGDDESRWRITTERLGTQTYPSIWNVDRLRNLAKARNRCLEQVGDLSRFDKIAYIEPDVTYDPQWCQELILARHPLAAGLGEPDIYSGWSLRSLSHPKESVFLYDTCATRAGPDDICWDVGEANGTWRGKTVIPTDLGGVDAMCLHPVWSTFNCFCVYNARPFINGHRWTYWNRRINPGSGAVVPHPDGGTAYLEADTVAICETFRQYGYTKVYLNTNCLVRHT